MHTEPRQTTAALSKLSLLTLMEANDLLLSSLVVTTGHAPPGASCDEGVTRMGRETASPHVQAVDVGIIRALRTRYCRLFIERYIRRYADSVAPCDVDKLYQLEATHLADNKTTEDHNL